MKTVILFASKYGYAREIAQNMSQEILGEVQLIDLEKETQIDLEDADTVILGSSIYVGQIHKSLKKLIETQHDLLLRKRLAIFLCCAFESEFEKDLQANFPKELLDHAVNIQNMGGRIDESKLSFAHKLMVSMISKTEAGKKPILQHDERIRIIIDSLNP